MSPHRLLILFGLGLSLALSSRARADAAADSLLAPADPIESSSLIPASGFS